MQNYPAKAEKLKKNFYLPADLAKRAERVAKEQKWNLSELLRFALEDFIQQQERKKVEKEIAEACKAYYNFDKEFAAEWAQFETRIE